MPNLKPDSLAFSLQGAARALARVRSGAALPAALAQVFTASRAQPGARGAVQSIAYLALRQRGRSDALIRHLCSKPPSAMVHALLEAALPLLQEESAGDNDKRPRSGYDAFTVVDQAVTAAAADPKSAAARGLINAVLRRFLREREALLAVVMREPEARWNYPAWWIAATKKAYPEQWQAILTAGNLAPPLTLRVNQRQDSVDDYLALLAAENMAAKQIGLSAIRLAQPVPVERLPGFAQGLASVQDAAAQLSAPLLNVKSGMRVLDACSAPGGKTGHLLELADIDLLALDQDAARLERIRENLQRLNLTAQVQQGDATHTDWWDGRPFDRILADVPCTASGIVRRHPDIRWLRRPDDTAQLAALAARILDNLWTMLRPGGQLLLVTCSLWPQESALQADRFAARHGALRLPAPGQLLPQVDASTDHDGLFHALFQKPVL